MSNLAIVIPAYKPNYLRKALDSISKQTNKDFCLYIGDDCSPYNLKEIVDDYNDVIDIEYYRFESNVGGKDLVKQWNRCISLSKNEEWIWLFSDDDIMDENCVQDFYDAIRNYPDYDLYHFNVLEINKDEEIIRKIKYPDVVSSRELHCGKILGNLQCYVVEFIFKRSVYEKNAGFVSFDLAWGSDIATWIVFSKGTGVKTIEGSCVRWRFSGDNISTDESVDILKRKALATLDFYSWSDSEFGKRNVYFINLLGVSLGLLPISNKLGYKFGAGLLNIHYTGMVDYCIALLLFTILYCCKCIKTTLLPNRRSKLKV